ncbi:Transcription factor bHLH49 [Hordeum vulgare]|nr:Transcription factor bHLH49 [Hordeum vulgare]
MDGDYVSGLLAGTAGLDFGVPGLNAGFFETLCGAGDAGAAGLATMFGDRTARMHGFGNGGQFGPVEGGGGELAAASREGSSVSDPAWVYGANAKKRKAPAAGAAKGKEAAATFAKVTPEFGLQMGEATGPDSKKCKIEDETVRPKVEEEAATTSDGSAGGERGRKQAKGKGSKSKQLAADEPPRDYVHVWARRGQATDSHSLAERALRDKKLKGQLAGKEKLIGISAKAAAQAEKWFLPIEGGYLEPEGLEKT